MTYTDLKIYFQIFHCGEITKKQLSAAIEMWNRAGNQGIKGHGYKYEYFIMNNKLADEVILSKMYKDTYGLAI